MILLATPITMPGFVAIRLFLPGLNAIKSGFIGLSEGNGRQQRRRAAMGFRCSCGRP